MNRSSLGPGPRNLLNAPTALDDSRYVPQFPPAEDRLTAYLYDELLRVSQTLDDVVLELKEAIRRLNDAGL